MAWAITATVATTAFSAISAHGQASAQAAYSKKQAAYNDKQNAKRAKLKGIQLDTNVVRARTETTAALEGIQSSANEAAANARVATAALGVGAGSYDTVLNSIARREGQAEAGTMQQLVAELVGSQYERENIGLEATAGMSTSTPEKPSAFGAILGGVSNYFQSTYGLKGALGLFNKPGSVSPSNNLPGSASSRIN